MDQLSLIFFQSDKEEKQDGVELCQAQINLNYFLLTCRCRLPGNIPWSNSMPDTTYITLRPLKVVAQAILVINVAYFG